VSQKNLVLRGRGGKVGNELNFQHSEFLKKVKHDPVS
jgi:hypothetical protein